MLSADVRVIRGIGVGVRVVEQKTAADTEDPVYTKSRIGTRAPCSAHDAIYSRPQIQRGSRADYAGPTDRSELLAFVGRGPLIDSQRRTGPSRIVDVVADEKIVLIGNPIIVANRADIL